MTPSLTGATFHAESSAVAFRRFITKCAVAMPSAAPATVSDNQ